MEGLVARLEEARRADFFANVLEGERITLANSRIFELTADNEEFAGLSINDVDAITERIVSILEEEGKTTGIGRHNENRTMYTGFPRFEGKTYHMGIDLWRDPDTMIYAPLDGKVHSFRDNEGEGDYGPTIILHHNLDGIEFYTLYGHLSQDSIAGMYRGKPIGMGVPFAEFGTPEENGGWTPHLHFMIITDMGEWDGDFPGVVSLEERERYATVLCPDPNLILGIEGLLPAE